MHKHPLTASVLTCLVIPACLCILCCSLLMTWIVDAGVTWDEPFYIVAGRKYIQGTLKMDPIKETWRYNHEHPPLAKLSYGAASLLLDMKHQWNVLATSRMAAAIWLCSLSLLTFWYTKNLGGLGAGCFAGFSIYCLPRLLAHGHFAALDLPMATTWMAVMSSYRHLDWKKWNVILFGLSCGAAALTKINAIGLLVGLLACQVFLRPVSMKAFLAGLGLGVIVFYLGWPWLWIAPVSHTREWLASATHRSVVGTYFLGKTFRDHYPPCYYPWIMTLVTIPIPMLVMIATGIKRCWPGMRGENRHHAVLITMIAWVLMLASMPQAPRYDGVRLFLPVFPMMACLAGMGWMRGCRRLFARLKPWQACGIIGLLLIWSAVPGWSMRPFGLSYYNFLVGGLPGAARAGFEISYWGDGIDRALLEWVDRKARSRRASVSFHHAGEWIPPLHVSAEMNKAAGRLHADTHVVAQGMIRVIANRRSMLTPEESKRMEGGRYLYARTCWGVPLAVVVEHAKKSRTQDGIHRQAP